MVLAEKGLGYNPRKAMYGSTKAKMDASETVYYNVAVEKVLKLLELENLDPSTELENYLSARADGKMAMDHFVKDKEGTISSVQSRFRAPKFASYGDFTIRYDKPSVSSYTGKTVECEFHHLNADLFLYGICDFDLNEDATRVRNLNKWILVSLVEFRKLVKEGKIVQDEKLTQCEVHGGKLYCPIKSNKGDKDTRFTVINIKLAAELFDNLILAQKNYVKK